MNDDQRLMIEAAHAAGKILLEGFGGLKLQELKGEHAKSVVTEFDRRAEKAILDILSPLGYAVIAEESGVHASASEYTWVIDPLDGTSNFSRGLPLFCVSIGLLKHGVPEMAVIYHPIRDELFFARRGHGAFLNGVKLQVSTPRPYVTVGFDRGARGRGSNPFAGMDRFFAKYNSNRILGTSALGLAYAAADRTDAYLSRDIEPWDVAAGILIATEAGLVATDWRGAPWTATSGSVLVAKQGLHQEMLLLLRDV